MKRIITQNAKLLHGWVKYLFDATDFIRVICQKMDSSCRPRKSEHLNCTRDEIGDCINLFHTIEYWCRTSDFPFY